MGLGRMSGDSLKLRIIAWVVLVNGVLPIIVVVGLEWVRSKWGVYEPG